MNAYPISQTFNGRVEWVLAGAYFKLLTAATNLHLELWKGGRLVLDVASAPVGFYQKIDFDKVVITNSANQLTEFIAAPADGGVDAITGNMNITAPLGADNADAQAPGGAASRVLTLDALQGYNGASFDLLRADNEGGGAGALRTTLFGDAITRAGASFHDAVNQNALAGAFNIVQLYNPAGSGVFVYLDAAYATDDTGGGIFTLRRYDVSLSVGSTGVPKSTAAAASKALIKAAQPAAGVGTLLQARRVNNSGPGEVGFVLRTPMRLSEGEGVIIECESAAHTTTVSLEWRELAA